MIENNYVEVAALSFARELRARSRLVPNSLIALTVAATATVLVGYFLSVVAPPNIEVVDPKVSALLLPNIVGVHPKPKDRFLFLALTLCTPFILLGAVSLTRKLRGHCRDTKPVLYALVVFATVICIVRRALPEAYLLFDGRQTFVSLLCLGFGAGLFFAYGRYRQVVNRAAVVSALIVSVVLVLLLRTWTVNNIEYQSTFTSHYEAAIFSVVHIAAGGTCLAGVIAQYGCYGEFLAPLFKLFGTSTTVTTLVFAILQIAAMWAAILFSAHLLRRPAPLVGCLLALICATGLNLTWWYIDPYLQYFPLRFVFPALSLWLALWYQNRPGLMTAWAIGVFCGAGLAWNLETGVAVGGSLALFVVVGNFTARPWQERTEIAAAGKRLLSFVAGAGMFVGLFGVYLLIKSSSPVDFSNFILFQKVFYLTGFAMIPIPAFPDYWTIHAAVLFCSLFLSALWLVSKDSVRDERLELAAYVAILGVGLFAYYSGRSHILVLRLVMWPSVILFFFMLERCYDEIKKPIDRWLVVLFTVLSVGLPAAFLLRATPTVGALVHVNHHSTPAKEAFGEDLSFVASHTSPGEAVAIVALNQGTLYGETRTRVALRGPSVAEMILRQDLVDQQAELIKQGPEKLFLGSDLSESAERGMLGTSMRFDLNRIQDAYALSAWGPGCRIMFLVRKPFTGKDLFEDYNSQHSAPCSQSGAH